MRSEARINDDLAFSKKILLLNRDLVFHGGIPRAFSILTHSITSKDFLIQVASFEKPSSEMSSAFLESEIPVHTIGDSGYWQPILVIRQLLLQENFDLVIAASFKSYLVAKIATTLILNKTRIAFWIQAIPLMPGRIRKWVFRILAKNDPLIFNSKATQQVHGGDWYQGQSWVIPYGVFPATGDNTPYSKSQVREILGLPENNIILGYTAEFTNWKDHQTLLEAFSLLTEKYPLLKLVLVGIGQIFEDMKNEAVALGISENVVFLGPRTDARNLLGLMDIYVHTAQGEAFGIAVAEAMLAAKPIIVANTGALPELIQHELNGLLFKAGNSHELSQNIERLLKFPSEGNLYGSRAKDDALKRYSPANFAHQIEQVMLACIGLQ